MSRYIDADVLIDDLIHNRSFYPALVASAIKNTPTADVVEVRHGEWIEKPNPWGQDGSHTYVCTECDEQISILGRKPKFCPECGAKMNVEQEISE